jgi:hypothetical protein
MSEPRKLRYESRSAAARPGWWRAVWRWLFDAPRSPSVVGAVVWWEARRIPVNLVLGVYGVGCVLAIYALVGMSGGLQPGEDVVEPMGVMLAGFAFNVCYTLGWLVEAPVRLFLGARSPELGPAMLKTGLAFSAFVFALPVVLSVGYLCLRALGVVR